MLYLLTEDSRSGFYFWERIKEVFQLNMLVVSSRGNTRMKEWLKNLQNPKSLQDGSQQVTLVITGKNAQTYNITIKGPHDRIIICYDLFDVSPDEEEKLVIDMQGIETAFQRNRLVYRSYYGCIESTLLSFKLFRAWVHTQKNPGYAFITPQETTLKTYNLFLEKYKRNTFEDGFYSKNRQECEGPSREFFNICDEIAERSDKPNKHKITNNERACAALLKHLTWGTDWVVDKGKLGTAFYHDCQDCTYPEEEKAQQGIEKFDCQHEHLSEEDLTRLNWNKVDVCDRNLANGNMTARKKLLTWLEQSDFAECFQAVSDLDPENLTKSVKIYSTKDVLGISHLHAADEPNNPHSACQTCRLRESPAYKETHQGAELQSVFDANQLPPPEPLPDTTPQWNQQQTPYPTGNTYQPQPPQSNAPAPASPVPAFPASTPTSKGGKATSAFDKLKGQNLLDHTHEFD